MEYHRVGDNRARHAAGLDGAGHTEQGRDVHGDVGTDISDFLQANVAKLQRRAKGVAEGAAFGVSGHGLLVFSC